jgi:hypothetical protein
MRLVNRKLSLRLRRGRFYERNNDLLVLENGRFNYLDS